MTIGSPLTTDRLGQVRAKLEASSLPMIVFSLPDLRVVLANGPLLELLELDGDAVIGRHAGEILGGGAERGVALGALADGVVDSYSARRQIAVNGRVLDIWGWVHRIEIDGGSVAVAIGLRVGETHSMRDLFAGTVTPGRLLELVHPEDAERLLSSLRRAKSVSESSAVDVRLRYPDGEWRSIRCAVSPPRDDTSDVVVEVFSPDPDPARDGAERERLDRLEHHVLRIAEDLQAAGLVRDAAGIHESQLEKVGRLSPRQREIVGALLRGERTSTMASTFGVSTSTVRNHLSQIFRVFRVHSQAELITALRSGTTRSA